MTAHCTPITPELRRVLEFVNTEKHDPPNEILANLGAARKWLAGSGLRGGLASGEDRLRLISLREALVPILESNAGHGDPVPAWARLEPFADAAPLWVRPGVKPELSPAGTGLAATIASILGAIYDAVHAGTWIRLKLCREASCRWAFYDESKNGSGTWCSMRVCGNRNKARRRRERSRPTS